MTDKMKMPEVGKSYKNKCSHETYLLQCIEIDNLIADKNYKLIARFKNKAYGVYVEEFWDEYEELSSETKEEPKLQEKDDVQYYKNSLRSFLLTVTKNDIQEMGQLFHQGFYNQLYNLAENLINALDDSNIPKKVDCGIVEDIKEEIPESVYNKLNFIKSELKFLIVNTEKLEKLIKEKK